MSTIDNTNLSHLPRLSFDNAAIQGCLNQTHHPVRLPATAAEGSGSSTALISYLTSLCRTSIYSLDSVFRHSSCFQELKNKDTESIPGQDWAVFCPPAVSSTISSVWGDFPNRQDASLLCRLDSFQKQDSPPPYLFSNFSFYLLMSLFLK